MRFILRALILSFISPLAASASGLQIEDRKFMPYRDCLHELERRSRLYQVSPDSVIEERDFKLIRLSTTDASIYITCDAWMNEMRINRRPMPLRRQAAAY